MALMKIAENVYLVPDVVANPYILVDADGLTLIDTGIPRSEKKILAYLSGLGKSGRDLKRIILTHSDFDHVGALAALKEATGARTYASQIEADAISTGRASRPIRMPFAWRRAAFFLLRPFMRARPVRVDEILTDGMVLPVLGGLRVLDTAGHTPGHISLYAPAAGVLFCGDSIVSDPDGLKRSRPPLTWDQARADDSVRKQNALKPAIVCSGHGPVVKEAAGKMPQV
jgi:glyoxylase-like metal-dependent hydrolase (beta-lactamase superfamily II)